MLAPVALGWIAVLALPPTSLEGTMQVVGSGISVQTQLKTDGGTTKVSGGLVAELRRLQGFRVELLGVDDQGALNVLEYRILDIGGGAKPLVGDLIREGERLAVRDGDGTPVYLSSSARTRRRLQGEVGAKVWVHGRKLVSGEIRILRYGVLRQAQRKQTKTQEKPKSTEEPSVEEKTDEKP